MSIGSMIRRSFGSRERQVADLYRSIFIDLDDFGRSLRELGVSPRRVLEIGAGEGAVTEIIAQVFPDASVLAIDIIPHVGRLYNGRENGVEFRQQPVQALAEDEPGQFDLVVMSDVLHHIPAGMRPEIIRSIVTVLSTEGRVFLKDWERNANPIYYLCYASDRWITGDRIAYLTSDEAKALVLREAPDLRVVSSDTVKPWSNNYALVFSK